jgi:hypothetical protein
MLVAATVCGVLKVPCLLGSGRIADYCGSLPFPTGGTLRIPLA